MSNSPNRIVIVGAGFAGVGAALGGAAEVRRHRAGEQIEIVLVAPTDRHVIRTRLYESDLSGVSVPLAAILDPVGVRYHRAAVVAIDAATREVTLSGDGRTLGYDQLVVCPGSARAIALSGERNLGVDTLDEAEALRATLGELCAGGRRPAAAVVGAGFTGIEVAAELSEVAEVTLLDAAGSIAPGFGPNAQAEIRAALDRLGVTQLPARAVRMTADGRGVELDRAERLAAELTVWATPLRASPLAAELGIPLDASGRIPVTGTLSAGVNGVWAAGDTARVTVDGRNPAVMSCQHAMPQGRTAGANAVRAALGRPPEGYSQPLYLTCLDLGRTGALLTCGFQRDDVLATGEQAKAFKRFINRTLIYPPTGGGPKPLLRLGRSGSPGRTGARFAKAALRSNAVRRIVTAGANDRAAVQAVS